MLVDAHNHLDLYADKLPRALEIINEKEIWTLACSMNKKDYMALRKIAKDQPFIIPSYGIHPWEVNPNLKELKNRDEIKKLIKESPMIGEIGLDFFWVEDKSNYPLQIEVLEFFFKEAKNYNKIVNLHTKGGEREVLNLLEKYRLKTPIIHWYSGPLNLLDAYMALDVYWTISVDITSSSLTRNLVDLLPMDRILTETDGPTALEWVNGNYAYPSYVEKIVEEIALIKNISYEACKKQIYSNFKNLISSINLNTNKGAYYG